MRIFRDESSLAANPRLWSSITEALDSSEWFVLLLSEDAASSECVGKEIGGLGSVCQGHPDQDLLGSRMRGVFH